MNQNQTKKSQLTCDKKENQWKLTVACNKISPKCSRRLPIPPWKVETTSQLPRRKSGQGLKWMISSRWYEAYSKTFPSQSYSICFKGLSISNFKSSIILVSIINIDIITYSHKKISIYAFRGRVVSTFYPCIYISSQFT